MPAQTKKEAKAQQKAIRAEENKQRVEILAQITRHRAIDQENEGRNLMVECNFKPTSPVTIFGTGTAIGTMDIDQNILKSLEEYRSLTTDLKIKFVFPHPDEEWDSRIPQDQENFILEVAMITDTFENLKTFVVYFKVETNIENAWPQLRSAAHFYANKFRGWELWVCYMGEIVDKDNKPTGTPVYKQCGAGGPLDRSLSGWRKALDKRYGGGN
ncbi:hypothetical protein GLAREA_08566 [Glarea lozoyensis ATCC 20868]|uniref:Uncharacterized protein n=2 Tax=Glarea lozoyensis TaxID=101852 RepID=S3DDH8_GLAL2|nr:uncharacterized protein GLAREA_08566 [Glarea lozoyensis ATCC 20868]EHL02323.1 hypothetical protein M7I_1668 [Glarea lozoyensis 74030]EPE24713.1 hypothetical protein GLAREA_08566 [Glarea lozoyensis ATCC 20868]